MKAALEHTCAAIMAMALGVPGPSTTLARPRRYAGGSIVSSIRSFLLSH